MVTSIESIFGISIHFEDRFRIISPPLPGLFTPLKWGFISTYATYNYLSKNHVGCLSRYLHFYVHFIVKLPVQPHCTEKTMSLRTGKTAFSCRTPIIVWTIGFISKRRNEQSGLRLSLDLRVNGSCLITVCQNRGLRKTILG